MARFSFSLQDVLGHRKRVEEDAQKKVAAIRIRLERCEGAIENLEKKRREASEEMYGKSAERVVPESERQIYTDYLWGAAKEIEKLNEERTALLEDLNKAREAMSDAMRQRELIDEVRKAQYADYLKAERLEERKLYDDLAQRAWRESRAESFLRLESLE